VVRSNAKAAPLQKNFASYITSGHLDFVVVPDMTVPGAFKEALKGIDGVLHIASSMPPMDPKIDPEVITGPAVGMTVGILEDAAKVPSVKRVVLTSSVVALFEPKGGKYVYTEVSHHFTI
jgi:nucleoside-diphosphate-sugar epimerase